MEVGGQASNRDLPSTRETRGVQPLLRGAQSAGQKGENLDNLRVLFRICSVLSSSASVLPPRGTTLGGACGLL